ncbi:hypothetical protein [Psychrobacillus sp.]|uniref:hypothetical protein n=1 Tax=Psychrobacillus sp. TaxID=1871623 RepID=UPI0028BE1691|nr:hypothetical protein [Psychrobacillus sp.]
MAVDENKWSGPYDFQTAIEEWAERNKTIMYQYESERGIAFERSVMHGGIPTTHNISKNHILKAKWYIEK